MAEVEFAEKISNLKKQKKVLKSKITKAYNSLVNLLNTLEVNADEVQSEFSHFNELNKEVKSILLQLQHEFADDDENLCNFIDEETELRKQYRYISNEVKNFLLNKQAIQDSHISAFSVTRVEEVSIHHDQVKIGRSSTPVDDDENEFLSGLEQIKAENQVVPFEGHQTANGAIRKTGASVYLTPFETVKSKNQAKTSEGDHTVKGTIPMAGNLKKSIPFEVSRDRIQENPEQGLNKSLPLSNPVKQDPEPEKPKLESEVKEQQSPHFTPYQVPYYATSMLLKPINITPFDGSYTNWVTFRDSFEGMIHTTSRPKIEKFHRLKELLTGAASSFIENVPLSEDNYEEVWNDIKIHYNNPQRIVMSHIQALMNLKPMKTQRSTELRTLVDTFKSHLRALKAAKQETNAEIFKIQLLVSKLDDESRMKWETRMSNQTVLPSLEDLYKSIEKRICTLEVCSSNHPSNTFKRQVSNSVVSDNNSQLMKCDLCSEDHLLYKCDDFRKLTSQEKLDFVRDKRLCFNCLKSNHSAFNCKSGTCREGACNRKHNTLLHEALTQNRTTVSLSTAEIKPSTLETIISTAKIIAYDIDKKPVEIRVMMDTGSQRNIISEDLVKKLKLHVQSQPIEIVGIGKNVNSSSKAVDVRIKSRISNYSLFINCSVMNVITEDLPLKNINTESWKLPPKRFLADPKFDILGKVDMLLSAAVYYDCIKSGIIRIGIDKPIAVNSEFGWLIGGGGSLNSSKYKVTMCLEKQLTKFWELETYPESPSIRSKEDQDCENIFVNSYRRENGRFIVKLPFRENLSLLGDNNRRKAEACWFSTEKKFEKDDRIKPLYLDFMKQYLELGHMQECPAKEILYFIPHHHVFKAGTSEEKFRVVFNASAKNIHKISLNDILMCGPTIQDNLTAITIRFRTHTSVLIGDITKMYRQILVDDSQRTYQGIVFRDCKTQPLRTFKLNTLTYGTAPAAFLATRCIKEISKLYQNDYPEAATVISNDFYMDDLLTGTKSTEKTIELRKQVQKILDENGLPMRKWMSNDIEVLKSIPDDLKIDKSLLDFNPDESVKTLGMFWIPSTDEFMFKLTDFNNLYTKRSILSDIARIFDPMGLIGPVIAPAKFFIQELWKNELEWDQELPKELQQIWNKFKASLKEVINIRIGRQLIENNCIEDIQLFGFCDASNKGYGACVYLVVLYQNGKVTSKLITSKARVAPLRIQSIPKLELCSAALLSDLIVTVKSDLKLPITTMKCFNDSKIVLSWISKEPSNWNTFVANRVSKIHDNVSPINWSHIISKQNPADVLSRGCDAENITKMELWWFGPIEIIKLHVISEIQDNLMNLTCDEQNIVKSEQKYVSSIVLSHQSTFVQDLYRKHEKLSVIIRIVAFVKRFIGNLRNDKKSGKLSFNEIQDAELFLVHCCQHEHYQTEIDLLKEEKPLMNNSKIKILNPFYDEKLGVLKMSGRLRNAPISTNQKYPLILPGKSLFTLKLFEMYHENLLHAGPKSILGHIRHKYWPINGRRTAVRVTRKCVKCFRVNPKVESQIMGDVPSYRVTPSKPFLNTGLDFAGPIKTKLNEGQRCRVTKDTYICIFVCCVTKAVHIECVSSLSTEAFIAALRRFVSRRGKVRNIYSDNGRNFVGANNELRKIIQNDVTVNMLDHEFDYIEWHFIPAHSPHMGGLWEANVKAMKSHLLKVIGLNVLNFEQLSTLLTQIEAVLNSRPLCDISDTDDDIFVLTPGHFLTGDNLVTVPDCDYTDINVNRLKHWHLVQGMTQSFWKLWYRDYIHSMQVRYKWKQKCNNVKQNDIVVIKQDSVKPLKWRLGRVMQVFPDANGDVRAVEVLVNGHRSRITVHKICRIPTKEEDTSM